MFKLRELRIENNVTQKQLAEYMNMSQGNVCEWEKGRSQPSMEALIKLADFFKVSVDELIGRTNIVGIVEVKNDLSDEESNLVQSFRQMNTAEKSVLNGYTEMIMKTHKGEAENKKSG